MNRLEAVRGRIRAAAERAGRHPEEVQLLGVSKRQSAEAVAELWRAGCRDFGENYVQEARDKQALLAAEADVRPIWHLIGPLQSNKAKLAAGLFDWIHTVDRLPLAQRLAEAAHAHGRALRVLVQVNTSGEASKSGVAPEEVPGLCEVIGRIDGLELRGLMCIPEPQEDPEASRPEFRRLRQLLGLVRERLGRPELKELSMGMSADLEVAVEEGATIVRVGTALFGARPET